MINEAISDNNNNNNNNNNDLDLLLLHLNYIVQYVAIYIIKVIMLKY